jgi:hypothetical protein
MTFLAELKRRNVIRGRAVSGRRVADYASRRQRVPGF